MEICSSIGQIIYTSPLTSPVTFVPTFNFNNPFISDLEAAQLLWLLSDVSNELYFFIFSVYRFMM